MLFTISQSYYRAIVSVVVAVPLNADAISLAFRQDVGHWSISTEMFLCIEGLDALPCENGFRWRWSLTNAYDKTE